MFSIPATSSANFTPVLRVGPSVKSILIQDSMFLNADIDFNSLTDYKMLYYFDEEDKTDKNYVANLIRQIEVLNNKDKVMELYKNGNWVSCWGGAAGITLEFLERLEKELSISKLKDIIKNRDDRIAFEHMVGLMCAFLVPKDRSNVSFFGSFQSTILRKDPTLNGLYNFDMYLKDPTRIKESLIKVWNGR